MTTEELDFLLRSIDDLESELAAGDIDTDDYTTLKADYTRRAADAIRAEESPVEAALTEADRSWVGVLAWLGGTLAVVAIAGLLVNQFSGNRTANDSITGDIRASTREMLSEAQQLAAIGDTAGAIEVYNEILELQSANVEALAYRGWFLRLDGATQDAQESVEEAVAVDPTYPDARVFAAVIAADVGDEAVARAHLEAFDALDAPPIMRDLVVQMGLRSRLLGTNDVLRAAEVMAQDGLVFEAIEQVALVLADRPNDVDLIAGYAWLLARAATPAVPLPADVAEAHLNDALVLEPTHPQSLVYRAFVRILLGNAVGAAEDLAVFDALPDRPVDLVEMIDAYNLRAQING
ncbi:MAG: hypothetical protein P8L46_04900 [Acidimicrobiales bacterium]|nr:hypothetical protein [Acidimicrobiales bacterium]MDG2217363.1 hypothetical protein [Acidimicrobiales bacterium]